jgi:hypothetical protein
MTARIALLDNNNRLDDEEQADMVMEISRAETRSPAAGPDDFFSGDVQVQPLFSANKTATWVPVRSRSPRVPAARGTHIQLAKRLSLRREQAGFTNGVAEDGGQPSPVPGFSALAVRVRRR